MKQKNLWTTNCDKTDFFQPKILFTKVIFFFPFFKFFSTKVFTQFFLFKANYTKNLFHQNTFFTTTPFSPTNFFHEKKVNKNFFFRQKNHFTKILFCHLSKISGNQIIKEKSTCATTKKKSYYDQNKLSKLSKKNWKKCFIKSKKKSYSRKLKIQNYDY